MGETVGGSSKTDQCLLLCYLRPHSNLCVAKCKTLLMGRLLLGLQVLSGNFCFDLPVWEGVSSEAKDLIVRLLVTDPSQRLTASEALLHPWIRCFYQQAKQPEPEPQHHKNAVSMVSLCAGLKSDLKRPMAAYSHRENKQRRSSSSQD